MSNPNYVKGRRKEYATVKYELGKGACIAFRSAGSHSPVDVVSINKLTRVIRLIQCKPDSMPLVQRDRLVNEHKELNNVYRVEFVVV